MTYGPVPLGPCWVADTSGKLTAAHVAELLVADVADYVHGVARGTRFKAVGRYLPLPGNNASQDIDAAELRLCNDAGLPVVFFQHVRGPDPWDATAAQGTADALHAAAHAVSAGITGGVHICKDCENCRTLDATACTTAFRDACVAAGGGAGFLAAAYQGFASGHTPAQLAALGIPIANDCATHPPPPGRGIVYKQHPQVIIGGMAFDPSWHAPDLTGAVLIGWGRLDPDDVPTQPALPEDDEPHPDVEDPHTA